MIKLSKFYDLLHKSVTVTLLPPGEKPQFWGCYYHGPVSNIPSEFDNYVVIDFHMKSEGPLVFYIVEHKNEEG